MKLERLSRVGLRLLLLVWISILWRGYRFGSGNQSLQVPLLKHLIDPTLYSRDLVVQTFHGYTSFFFGGLARILGTSQAVEPSYFGLFVLFEWLSLGAVFALTMLAFEDARAAFVACLLYVPGILCPGAESTNQTLFTHSGAVGAILLWDIYLWAKGKRLLALGIAGLCFNLHALYALHVAALFVVDALLGKEGKRRDVLLGLASFVLLALPTLVWLAHGDGVTASETTVWLGIIRERSANHAFPLAVPREAYGEFLLFICLGVFAYRSIPEGPFHGTARRLSLGVFILVAAALVFSEWLPVVPVIRSQPLRSTKWLGDLVLVFGGGLFVSAWSWGWPARLALAFLALGWLGAAPLWLLAGLVILVALPSRQKLGLLVPLGVAAWLLRGGSWGPMAPLWALRGLVTSAGPVVLVGLVLLWSWGRRDRLGRVFEIVAGCGLLASLPFVYARERAAVHALPWTLAQEWARNNTPPDSVFLTPPDVQGFRVFSERAIVGEWKDGTQQFFSAPYAIEWRRRMGELRGGTGYGRLGTEALLSLGREYGAQYAVCRSEQRVALPPLYENQVFSLYALPVSP